MLDRPILECAIACGPARSAPATALLSAYSRVAGASIPGSFDSLLPPRQHRILDSSLSTPAIFAHALLQGGQKSEAEKSSPVPERQESLYLLPGFRAEPFRSPKA